MPANDLSIVWDEVKSGIDDIFKMVTIKPARYMKLYTFVFNYCTYVELHPPSYSRFDEYTPGAKFVGLELYKRLRDYLKAHVCHLKTKGDNLKEEEMLSYFEKTWEEYRFAANVLHGVCSYLNNHFVKRECDEGRKNIYPIFSLALITWQEHLLKPHSRTLIAAILQEINRERHGEVLLTSRLRKIIGCLIDLGMTCDRQSRSPSVLGPPSSCDNDKANFADESVLPSIQPSSHEGMSDISTAPGSTAIGIPSASDSVSQPPCAADKQLVVYRDFFERHFIMETEQFYRFESMKLLQSLSISEYLQKVDVMLTEERSRVQSYLHQTTLPKLIYTCESYLLREHLERLADELVPLLNDDREDDIGRLYRLIGHFPKGLRTLMNILEETVGLKGSEAMRQVASTAINDPVLYVDTILQIYQKYSRLVLVAFSGDGSFVEALDKGCERFINRNAVTELAGNPRKSPELLAKYADILLKKGPKDHQSDDLDEALGQVMNVFKYLEDKDVFQKFYIKTLARRLVYNQSVSDDAESSMISKLKETCGFEYTSKMQRMYQDVNATRVLNSQFNDFVKAREAVAGSLLKGIDFNVMILSLNAWPYQLQVPFSIPPELEQWYDTFRAFYREKHTGRKLNWCYQLSRGEVVTNYTKTIHVFLVSTHQAAVLMLFNNSLVHSVGDIQSNTSIEMSILLQVLQILIKAKVLKIIDDQTSSTATSPSEGAVNLTSGEESSGPQLSSDTKLALCTGYKNKRVRVYLNVPLKSEAKQEVEHVLCNVDLDRKLIVQACIVRIMKTRKLIKHTQLINEVIAQLSSRFKPTIPTIKKCISELIEKEYLKRGKADRDSYEYIA